MPLPARFRSLSPARRIAALLALAVFTLYGGGKGELRIEKGESRIENAGASRIPRPGQFLRDGQGGGGAAGIPSAPVGIGQTAVSNLSFSTISTTTTNVSLGIAWSAQANGEQTLDIYSKTNLLGGRWLRLAEMDVDTADEAATADIPLDWLDSPPAAFFNVGDRLDSDGDGLPDAFESLSYGTDAALADTDSDGLDDGQEYGFGTSPVLADTDGDRLTDGEEAEFGTDPFRWDTDWDRLDDIDELGKIDILTGNDFLWFDLTNGVDLVGGRFLDGPTNTWSIPVPYGFHLYGEVAGNALAGVNGIVHFLSPAHPGGTALFGHSHTGGLANRLWSDGLLSVAACNAHLRCRPEWGSAILHGFVEDSDGCGFNVVEYRNIGLAGEEWTNQLITCQLLAPIDDFQTIYVSYLSASNAFDEADILCGVQRGNIPSLKTGETYYNLTWAQSARPSLNRVTVKYTVGTGSDPLDPDTDGDGLDDGQELAWLKTSPCHADTPGASSPDWDNNVVDGLSDLVDFFPVHIGFGEALATILGIPGVDASKVEVNLSCDGAALGCAETDFTAATAGRHLSDPSAGVESAAVAAIGSSAATLSPSFVAAMRQDPEKGVVLLEGKTRSASGTAATLAAELRYDGECVLSNSLHVLVAPSDEFYRWHNYRAVAGGAVSDATDTEEPAAFPDSASNQKNIVFIHGFRVSEAGARGWSAEMFKRLWQSGCNAKFHVVTWRGDCGLPDGMFYHENVHNAFLTAQTFASAFSGAASDTTILAHSLGNMVVCSAIQDHGLRPARYFMLNAAIPVEAFDPTLGADYSTSNSLVHPDWHDYASRTWSARWHELFIAADDRSKLTWRGRFADVASYTDVYNFHSGTENSPGDEVLQIRDTPPEMLDDLHYGFPASIDFGHYSWHKQEMGKGRLTVVNPLIAGTTWAGWGFHETNVWIEVGEQLIRIPFPIEAPVANAMTGAELRTYPVFRHSPTNLFTAAIPSNTVAEILACGIPALSGPAGSRALPIPKDYNLNQIVSKTHWPRNLQSMYQQRWLHSDIKNIALPIVFDIFQRLSHGGVAGGSQ